MSNLTSRPNQPDACMDDRPHPGTPVTVDVLAEKDGKGGVCFSHEWEFRGHSRKKGDLDVPQKKKVEAGTVMHFRLKDKSGRGLRFEDRVQDAIWIQEDCCPETVSHTEFDLRNAEREDMRIAVLNTNRNKCELHYRLNFLDAEGEPVCYDPIIRNGGSI